MSDLLAHVISNGVIGGAVIQAISLLSFWMKMRLLRYAIDHSSDMTVVRLARELKSDGLVRLPGRRKDDDPDGAAA